VKTFADFEAAYEQLISGMNMEYWNAVRTFIGCK
jgi:hypothetical protein